MAIEFNSTLKGLNLDVSELQAEGMIYSFALNATIENYSEPQTEVYRSNMASNVYCYELTPGEKIVGHSFITEFNKTLLFTYNESNNDSKIIDLEVIKKDPYTTDQINCSGASNVSYIITKPQCNSSVIAISKCFDWSESPQILYKITDCSINYYFVNGHDEDRILNFDYDESFNLTLNNDFKKSNNQDCEVEYINEIECLKTKWNPIINYPCITLEEIQGNKEKGSYEYLVCYSTYSGIPLTSFKSLTQPFHIKEKGGGVRLNFSNVSNDSRYRFITIVSVETVLGVTTYHKKDTISVNQKLYIDIKNGGENISLNNLFAQYPFYKSSKDFTESNNILFKASVSEYEKFNLQPVINLVETEWVSIVAKEGDYRDSEFANKYKSALRDEVFPYGVKIILDNGELGPSFILVSRAKESTDSTAVTGVIYGCNNRLTEKWQVENTASITYNSTVPINELAQNCQHKQIYQAGKFAYWESTETYPNNPIVWGDLCGKPVRHFKYPDIVVSPHQSNNSVYNNGNYIFPLGIRIKSNMEAIFDLAVTNGLITQEQRDRIVGYKLLRGDRQGNKSIIAKGLLYDVWSYNRTEEKDPNFLNSCDSNEESVWVNTGSVYCTGSNSYQNQTDQFGNTRVNLVMTNDPSCIVPQALGLSTYKDDIWGVAHGQNGHHYLKLFVDITGYTPGNTLWISVSGDSYIPYFDVTSFPNFSFKFPHSNCCGNPGCGYIVTLQERDSLGVTVIHTITNPPVELCSTNSLYSAQNPVVLTCSVSAGINQVVQVQSTPAIIGYTIKAYLDGDSTYTPVATATTGVSGIASVILPNAVNGQKYWFAESYTGYAESFGNSVVIGGSCKNLILNPVSVCTLGGANVTFSPTGGGGTYSYSLDNNDIGGYSPLTTIFIPNGTRTIYIRDDSDHDYKVMYSVVVAC